MWQMDGTNFRVSMGQNLLPLGQQEWRGTALEAKWALQHFQNGVSVAGTAGPAKRTLMHAPDRIAFWSE